MEGIIKYRHNIIDVNSMEAFAEIRGGFHENSRDVYFVRMLGRSADFDSQVRRMDEGLYKEMQAGRLYYRRIGSLPGLTASEEIAYYVQCYEQWIKAQQDGIRTKVCRSVCSSTAGQEYMTSGAAYQEKLARQLGAACREVLILYQEGKAAVTESVKKNFAVKLFYWFDFVCSGLQQWNERSCIKIVAENAEKEQEYLFYYFLTLAGCDVLLLQSAGDPASEKIKRLSEEVRIGAFSSVAIPQFHAPVSGALEHNLQRNEENRITDPAGNSDSGKIVVKIPQRRRQKRGPQNIQYPAPQNAQQPQNSGCPVPQNTQLPQNSGYPVPQSAQQPQNSGYRVPQNSGYPAPQNAQASASPRREKTFEELAALASSIVLLLVHDQNGEVIATGSGIMIGRAGYILTNDHVARGGDSYSVRIENDEQVYQTDELIKYNTLLDLALLRIQRRLEPIPIYQGSKKLVRGQAVAAIGSPLGLFNSISDGIISGFRTIDGVDMIQFTAPISHGSSGGAVLNMYGEVIGISTAGFDRGQNINLAVGYESINMFIQGFLS